MDGGFRGSQNSACGDERICPGTYRSAVNRPPAAIFLVVLVLLLVLLLGLFWRAKMPLRGSLVRGFLSAQAALAGGGQRSRTRTTTRTTTIGGRGDGGYPLFRGQDCAPAALFLIVLSRPPSRFVLACKNAVAWLPGSRLSLGASRFGRRGSKIEKEDDDEDDDDLGGEEMEGTRYFGDRTPAPAALFLIVLSSSSSSFSVCFGVQKCRCVPSFAAFSRRKPLWPAGVKDRERGRRRGRRRFGGRGDGGYPLFRGQDTSPGCSLFDRSRPPPRPPSRFALACKNAVAWLPGSRLSLGASRFGRRGSKIEKEDDDEDDDDCGGEEMEGYPLFRGQDTSPGCSL